MRNKLKRKHSLFASAVIGTLEAMCQNKIEQLKQCLEYFIYFLTLCTEENNKLLTDSPVYTEL